MKKITSDIIIIGLLWLGIIISLFFNSILNPKFIFGIIGLAIVSATYRKFNEFSFGILLLILLLSIFDVVSFSNAFTVNFGFINILNLALFCILFFTQIDKFFRLKDNWSSENKAEIENHKNNRVIIFKAQFKNLNEKELKNKLEDEQLVEDAKVAIRELLVEISESPAANS